MCLDHEWFLKSDLRKEKRNADGVSLTEAINALFLHESTAYPVATEMAGWIYSNWSLEQINELPEKTRVTFYNIIGNDTAIVPAKRYWELLGQERTIHLALDHLEQDVSVYLGHLETLTSRLEEDKSSEGTAALYSALIASMINGMKQIALTLHEGIPAVEATES